MVISLQPFIPREAITEAKRAVTPQQAAAHFGVQWPARDEGELRVPSIFAGEAPTESSYGSLCINLDHPDNRFFDHVSGIKGDLLVLIHGLLTNGQPPQGGQLRGNEFRTAASTLIEISSGKSSTPIRSESVAPSKHSPPPQLPNEEPTQVNPPIAEIEKAKQYATLFEEFITDEASMSPTAAQYVRRYPFLTEEIMQRWRIGYIPKDGRSMLRGMFAFTHVNEDNEVISYSGRRLNYEKEFRRFVENGRPEGKHPEKHKFIKGFHKGSTLYGNHGQERIKQNPLLRQSLQDIGLVVCEGQLDTIRLDCLNVASVSLLTNRATDHQIEALTRYALKLAGGRIVLLPDNDDKGEEEFATLLWKLAQNERLTPLLGWSRRGFDGHFDGTDPAQITEGEWQQILYPSLLRRWS